MNKKGFTLVELMAVIVIIGIIALIAVVGMSSIQKKSELKMIESNFDLMLTAGSTYGEDHFSTLTTDRRMYISTLKTYTELSLDERYNQLIIKVYKRNNRASSCIVKEIDKLHNIALTDEEITQFEKYFCNDSLNPDATTINVQPNTGEDPMLTGNYAMFDTGPKVNKIMNKLASKLFTDGSRELSWCNDCSSMNMGYGLDNNYYDLFYNETSDQFCSDAAYGICDNNLPVTSKIFRINISSSDSPHKIYLIAGSAGRLYYYTDVTPSEIYLNANASYMFNDTSFTTLDLSNWNTSNVLNISNMFASMDNLYSINISGWDLSSVNNTNYVFNNTNNVERIKTPSSISSGYSINLPYSFKFEHPSNCNSGSSGCTGHLSYYSRIDSTTPRNTWIVK